MIALGTNAVATAHMIKAGADKGATGENAVCHTVARAEWLLGPVAVTWVHALEGEVTPKMAAAIISSPAVKVLLPMAQERIGIVGVLDAALPDLVRLLIDGELKVLLGGGDPENRRAYTFYGEPARHPARRDHWTGASQVLVEAADLVTEMRVVKHPLKAGCSP
ncbi:DUF3842 family protein [Desulfatitalea sp. M08but]|uniref:DUF3842 family protein n=1 Tax=Desulfatitalea alkaliphila TaxID=2929485 RepID=A0AA41R069_9BACT|nr:DUF3842 family protein [Desulfatitalea alkaliphila]